MWDGEFIFDLVVVSEDYYGLFLELSKKSGLRIFSRLDSASHDSGVVFLPVYVFERRDIFVSHDDLVRLDQYRNADYAVFALQYGPVFPSYVMFKIFIIIAILVAILHRMGLV